ncbi:cold shock protein [Natrarchaeobaculum sulfurireducens]|uniref:Cold shock protein n=2 Tax=Natrarchaeobaculum sulfurireducens TaxID=2044521 RepID=A0A346PH77_9EURY|nr:Cold shock protein, CspA family [Natrarchaeobaculum sulfurireducens]AXR81082.1 cold shock protein [Natrarchaeobaculum sulfurireducens]
MRQFCFRISFFGERMPTLIRVVALGIDAMANGKVDFFNDTGGYGFIDTDDADEDVFFHMEDVGGEDLTEGTEIEFDIEQAPKGPRAKNVVRL